MGTVTTHGHTYTVIMDRYAGPAKFMNGGIAKDLYLHGVTGHGAPILPKVYNYLAGWGRADVYKDGRLLYKHYFAHFMLTDGVRNKVTHKIDYPGPMQLMKAKKQGDKEAIKAAVQQIKKAAGKVDTSTQQLHIIVHSGRKNPNHFPPFQVFVHFMWDQVTWH